MEEGDKNATCTPGSTYAGCKEVVAACQAHHFKLQHANAGAAANPPGVPLYKPLVHRCDTGNSNCAQQHSPTSILSPLPSLPFDSLFPFQQERMDGTQVGSVQVSQDKAATAVRFKRPSKAFQDMILGGQVQMQKLTGRWRLHETRRHITLQAADASVSLCVA